MRKIVFPLILSACVLSGCDNGGAKLSVAKYESMERRLVGLEQLCERNARQLRILNTKLDEIYSYSSDAQLGFDPPAQLPGVLSRIEKYVKPVEGLPCAYSPFVYAIDERGKMYRINEVLDLPPLARVMLGEIEQIAKKYSLDKKALQDALADSLFDFSRGLRMQAILKEALREVIPACKECSSCSGYSSGFREGCSRCGHSVLSHNR